MYSFEDSEGAPDDHQQIYSAALLWMPFSRPTAGGLRTGPAHATLLSSLYFLDGTLAISLR